MHRSKSDVSKGYPPAIEVLVLRWLEAGEGTRLQGYDLRIYYLRRGIYVP